MDHPTAKGGHQRGDEASQRGHGRPHHPAPPGSPAAAHSGAQGGSSRAPPLRRCGCWRLVVWGSTWFPPKLAFRCAYVLFVKIHCKSHFSCYLIKIEGLWVTFYLEHCCMIITGKTYMREQYFLHHLGQSYPSGLKAYTKVTVPPITWLWRIRQGLKRPSHLGKVVIFAADVFRWIHLTPLITNLPFVFFWKLPSFGEKFIWNFE